MENDYLFFKVNLVFDQFLEKCYAWPYIIYLRNAVLNISELDVYAMGQKPWCEFIISIINTPELNLISLSNSLTNYCLKMGLVSERLSEDKEVLYGRY